MRTGSSILNATLVRLRESDHGTEGIFILGAKNWRIMELPWRDNKTGLSCIPTGTYNCVVHHSRKYGRVWHVTGVDGRTWILIHNGNYAGDKLKGWKTHSMGCLIIGKKFGIIGKQRAVLASRVARREFQAATRGLKTFQLTIIGGA